FFSHEKIRGDRKRARRLAALFERRETKGHGLGLLRLGGRRGDESLERARVLLRLVEAAVDQRKLRAVRRLARRSLRLRHAGPSLPESLATGLAFAPRDEDVPEKLVGPVPFRLDGHHAPGVLLRECAFPELLEHPRAAAQAARGGARDPQALAQGAERSVDAP